MVFVGAPCQGVARALMALNGQINSRVCLLTWRVVLLVRLNHPMVPSPLKIVTGVQSVVSFGPTCC
jgi:hypothetical protein